MWRMTQSGIAKQCWAQLGGGGDISPSGLVMPGTGDVEVEYRLSAR
jgi:hypothetical protein